MPTWGPRTVRASGVAGAPRALRQYCPECLAIDAGRFSATVVACVLAALMILGLGTQACAQAGDFAPGAIVQWSLAGVRAEIGILLVIPPDLVAGRLPAGFTPRTLRALTEFPPARTLLRKHPGYADYVLSVFAFGRLDSLSVDGALPHPESYAYWTVVGRGGDSARAIDPRGRGEAEVELGQWTSDTVLAERLRVVTPEVGVAPFAAVRAPDGSWRIRLSTPDATVRVTCRPLGAPRAMGPLDQVTMGTHWVSPNGDTRALLVFASNGSREQRCGGASWSAIGSGPLAQALRRGAVIQIEDQTGWRANAAAYTVP